MLAISKLNGVEVLISKALIDSVNSHNEFILITNVLKNMNERRSQKFKDLIKFIEDFILFTKQSSYCLKFRKNTETKNLKVARTKNGRIILLSKYAVFDSKKSKFIKEYQS